MARVPRRLMKDAGTVDLSPEERHLLECIDGSLGEDELGFVTGRAPEEIATMLAHLVDEGLVRFGAETPSEDGGSEQPPPSGDGIQLSVDERGRVDKYFVALETADYYALLDIPRDATEDEVKKAYYQLAPKFHPDKHYGKELGGYKGKIEKIFSTLTRAHDTLRYAKRRSSYDVGLPPLKAGDRIRRRPAPEPPPPEPPPPPRHSRPSNPGRGSDPAGPSSQPRASQPTPSRPSSPPRQSIRPRTTRRSSPVSKAEREALARKLGHRGSGPPPRTKRRAAVAEVRQGKREIEDKPRTRKSAAEMLRSRYDEVRDTAKRRRLAKYLETARVAMEAGDYRAASAAFAQALRISPEDDDIQRKSQMAQELALDQPKS